MKVNGHSFKPKVRFFGKDQYHLGVELELEAPSHNIMLQGLGLMDNPVYCYAKHDGSLNDFGWELVTHPIARRSWLAKKKLTSAGHFLGFVHKLREIGYTSHVGSRCGLHIHIGLDAFNRTRVITNYNNIDNNAIVSRKPAHLYWFVKLVNSDLFKKLSQRSDDTLQRWARVRSVNALNFVPSSAQTSRYLATNITEKTCEVRLFRGNMREDRIRKAVESVIAAVEFSRTLTSNDLREAVESDDHLVFVRKFIKYVENNDDTYPNLAAFLVEIGQSEEKKGEVS